MRRGACIVCVLAVAAVGAETEGWRDFSSARSFPKPIKELWRAPIEQGVDSFSVEWRDGATGEVSVAEIGGRLALRIAKRNARGLVVVTAKDVLKAAAGAKIRAAAGCEANDADSEFSYGYLAVYDGDERLFYDSSCSRGSRGGQKQTVIANTENAMPVRKLAHTTVKADGSVSAAIVVASAPSTSFWTEWTLEDFSAADSAWWDKVRKRKPPATAKTVEMSDADLDALALAGPDHTARIERRNGCVRLLVDGKPQLPVFFKGSTSAGVCGFYGGSKMAEAGIDLQSVFVRLGKPKLESQGNGFWTKDGFNVKGAVSELRRGMKRAPNAKYLLSVDVSAYHDFCDEHPDETWVNEAGRRVFGSQVHSPYQLPKKMDSRYWYWASNHSSVWREAAKGRLTELVAELKRTGLSRMFVGVHIAGYHDAQFATVHLDYSKPAVAAFRRWLPTKYESEASLRRAWRDDGVTFETATPPVLHYNYCQHNYFVPGADQAAADYAAFLKKGPFHAQEEFSRHLKRLFGKDIVTVRYCMGAFGGTFCSAYDITPFLESDTIDILCSQPRYGRRMPAIASGYLLPFDSFRKHGKLFLAEFDLRTYGAMTGWETEVFAMGCSSAVDDAMWAAINRKLAGQMYANRQGWWYLDMAGGWYEPDGIASDISETLAAGRALLEKIPSGWRPDVALVIDEDGALMRNTMSQYFNPDEQTLMGEQVQALAGSGVPFDRWMLKDWLAEPKLAERYRAIVFWGLYDVDDERSSLLTRLSSGGRTLVFLAGTGVSRGADALGFRIGVKKFPAQHETRAEPGVQWNMGSLLHASKVVSNYGISRQTWTWQLSSPARLYIEESSGQKVLARFSEDGSAAVAERLEPSVRKIYVASYGGLTPDYFHYLAASSGAYVPTDAAGIEVDMNGDFLSVHCLRGGTENFALPFPARVTNLKTGRVVAERDNVIKMDLQPGETRWYALEKSVDLMSGNVMAK